MEIRFSGLRELLTFLGKFGTRGFGRAAAKYVNDQLFRAKKAAFGELEEQFVIRNRRFMIGVFPWQKSGYTSFRPGPDGRFARARGGVLSRGAYMGTTTRDRFSGWIEQETGKKTERKRTISLEGGRGGVPKNILRQPGRLQPGRELPDTHSELGSVGNVVGMLRSLARRQYRGAFMIHPGQHPKFPAGVYKFKGRRRKNMMKPVSMIQMTHPKRVQPKKNKWMRRSLNKFAARTRAQNDWNYACRWVFSNK